MAEDFKGLLDFIDAQRRLREDGQLFVRREFEAIRDDLLSRGYRASQRRKGLNFNRGTRLQWFWVAPEPHAIHVGYCAWNLPALFGIDEDAAVALLGDNWLTLEPSVAREQVRRWVDSFEALSSSEPVRG